MPVTWRFAARFDPRTLVRSLPEGAQRSPYISVSAGGPPGDLYVFLSVKKSKDFTREGADVYSNVRTRAR